MRWLDRLSPTTLDFKIESSIFVFEDTISAVEYATQMEIIETSPNIELVENVENWDQTGLLTRVITYKKYKGIFDEQQSS